MTNTELALTILSPGFAATFTSILRRMFPRIDGPGLVWGIVVALSIVGNVAILLASGRPAWAAVAWAAARGLVGGIVVCGTVNIVQNAVAKGRSTY